MRGFRIFGKFEDAESFQFLFPESTSYFKVKIPNNTIASPNNPPLTPCDLHTISVSSQQPPFQSNQLKT
jgi:hypothetical protein